MADVYWNYTSGNDSTGDGTASLPYKTVQKAHDMASSGDTLILQAGTHALTAAMNLRATKTVTVSGETNADGCVLDGGTGYQGLWWRVYNTSDITLTIEKIRFYRLASPEAGGLGFLGPGNGDPEFTGSSHIIQDCKMEDIRGTRGLIFTLGYGQSFTDCSYRVERCLVIAPAATSAWYLILSRYQTYPFTMRNCTFVIEELTYNMLWNKEATFTGVVTWKNNIFYLNRATNVALAPSGLTYTFDNNLTYNASTGIWTSIPTGSNNLTIDPQFADAANADYTPTVAAVLTGGSPS